MQIKRAFAGFVAAGLLALPAFGQTASAPSSGIPIATVDGQPVYVQDLPGQYQAALLRLRNQEYQTEIQGLESLIRQKLVENEASKQGISSEQLLQKEADSKISPPTEAEIEGYYAAVRDKINQPLDQAKPQLEKDLRALKIQQARQGYIASLRAKASVVVLLSRPKVEVAADPARIRGNPDAPVTIVEFADYQCPYCRHVEATLRDILKKYPGQVKLSYRDFPLPATMHPNAYIAAEASRCAEAQGKFWEYHDALFADQSKLDRAGLEATASRLGLNTKAFDACLASGRFKTEIQQDFEAGRRAGVQGTPGFFINGEFINGAQPEAVFTRIINRQLAAIGKETSRQASR